MLAGMVRRSRITAIVLASAAAGAAVPGERGAAFAQSVDAEVAGRFAALALACAREEYPNKISHVLASDADVRPPRELTPAFYGCYDWHSAVHGHWLLARLTDLFPDAPFAPAAREALAANLTPANIAAELAYLGDEGRASFERPYGLAWLLQLATELRRWDDPDASRWGSALAPLESDAAARLASWLPRLYYPIRTGEHNQTAFSFGLAWDWTGAAGDTRLRELLEDAARRFYLDDRDCPLAYEPSGEDFLSPCLAEADFMRRVLDTESFGRWLSDFLPGIPTDPRSDWLPPAVVTDRSDPKLAHIDGLNLSRAWMLEGIAHALGEADPRHATLTAAAAAHREAALPAVTGEHYEGGHWLGSFAVYLTTRAGID
jgi:hypothetical protein